MATKALVDTMIAEFLAGDESIVPVLQDAIDEGVTGAGKLVYKVMTRKSHTWKGKTTPEERIKNAFAIVNPGKSIRLIGYRDTYDWETKTYTKKGYDKTYNVGDWCLRYSYNGLDYFGFIENVSAKTVVMREEYNDRKERHDLAKFWSNNIGFDKAASDIKNANWMD